MRWLIVALLLLGVVAPANAQTYTREQAWTNCRTRAAQWDAEAAASTPPGPTGHWCKEYVNSPTSGYVGLMSPPPNSSDSGVGWNYSSVCPNGGRWSDAEKKCAPSEDECKAKPPLSGGAFTTAGSGTACSGGCLFIPTVSVCTATNGKTICAVGGARANGAMCGVGDPPPTADKPQECVPSGGGQTFCLKPDGQHCSSASNGRQVCWKPGETGEKDDGNVKQKRDAGTDPIPPNLQLPSGDNLSPQGPPVQAVTNVNNQTIVTVTQNYSTQHGTNAGTGTNKGESATGDGTGKEGDGKGSASGGGNCETPPIVSGDPVLGMVATQAWATRCAVEAGNAAKVTGDVANCAQAFTVEGTNANAIKLRAMRAQLCKGDANGDGQPDWTKPDGTEAGEGGDDDQPGLLSKMINTDLLDTSGFMGGNAPQCPQLGTLEFGPFGSFSLDSVPYWCDLITLMRGVILLVGIFIALRILTGDVL